MRGYKDATTVHQKRKDRRRGGFREVTSHGTDLYAFGALKATCTEARLRKSCSTETELLSARKVLKNCGIS